MIVLTNFKNHLECHFFKITVRFLVRKVFLKKKVTDTLIHKNQEITKNINVLTLFFLKGQTIYKTIFLMFFGPFFGSRAL